MRIPPHSIADLHQPLIEPSGIFALEKPLDLGIHVLARELGQRVLEVAVQDYLISGKLGVDGGPLRGDVGPEGGAGARVGGESDACGLRQY